MIKGATRSDDRESTITMRINNTRTVLLTSAAVARAFNNQGGWKKDADGKLEMDANGNPIYVDGNGREMVTEAGTIARLNGEAQTHRTAKEAAEAKLKAFTDNGITDPAKAKDALEKLSKLDQKQLIDSGEVEKVRHEVGSQYQAQLDEQKKLNEQLAGNVDSLRLENAFTKSEFVNNKIAVPPEMFLSTFGKHFKIEEGKPVPYGPDGNRIMSKTRFGETASVDEAFEILVEQYPHKDAILKADAPNGGGGGGGGGGNRPTGRTVKRADFDTAQPMQKAQMAAQMSKGEIQIVD